MSTKYKVVLLGNAFVGKTSIADRLTTGVYYASHGSTIGAAYSFLKKGDINMDLWDTAGQERYLSLVPMYFKNADIILLVFDLSDTESLERVDYFIEKIEEEVKQQHTVIIIGNKHDLVTDKNIINDINRQVTKKYSSYNHVFVSAKTGHNIDKLTDMMINSCKSLKKDKDTKVTSIKLEATDTNETNEHIWSNYCPCG